MRNKIRNLALLFLLCFMHHPDALCFPQIKIHLTPVLAEPLSDVSALPDTPQNGPTIKLNSEACGIMKNHFDPGRGFVIYPYHVNETIQMLIENNCANIVRINP